MKPINIRVDRLENPLGLQNGKPTITWTCDSGKKQTAYCYEISVNGESKFTSEKIMSSEMSFVMPFEARDRDQVKVRISLWDENDMKGEASETSFEMGISEWKASWIDPEVNKSKERQPASYLKREFNLEKSGTARLYITAHGLYEAKINGKRVGDFVLAPGTDDYNKRLQYQVYDVTDLLRQGNNVIEVCIGDGWYRGNNGIDGDNHLFGDDVALLCQLEIDKEAVLVSDKNWFASQNGPIRFSDMEIGEVYDANKEGIDEWHEVREVSHDKSKLVCSDEVYIKEHEIFEGKRINTPDNAIVYDFSQNMAGYTCFRLNAKEGQKLTIWHGETLDEEGNFTQRNIDPGARNKNGGIPQKIEYICKEGLNEYKPHFSIFGFQYIKVETDADLSDAEFKAIAVYSDMKQTATFKCSNEDVNKLFSNSLWSMKSNFVDIPTDCPQRERSGWTGDAGVFVDTGLLLHDCYTVFKKWLREVRLAQKGNGIIRNIAPPINRGTGFSSFIEGSTGWGDAILLVPYALYKAYDDKSILLENYEAMVKWVGYLQNLAKKNKLKDLFKKDPHKNYVITKGFHWGEWCQPDVDSSTELRNNMTKGAPKSATAYYYYSSKLLSEIASVLGRKEDAEKYEALSEKIREAYISTFTDEGIIHSDRQCNYVRPLEFGLVDNEEKNAEILNQMIIDNDYRLNTGFLSTPFLCPILCKYGYVETAYKLLLQDKLPSWLYSVKKGSTSIWENWNGIENGNNGSLNHYSYGAVSGWLIKGVCGIDVSLGNVTIKPCPNELLQYAKATYDSPVGKITSGWRYTAEGIEFNFAIPANVKAEIELPNGETHSLDYGDYSFFISK